MMQNCSNIFDAFQRESDFDIQFFLRVIGQKSHSCYYYGDLKKNVFIISENCRQKFGFESILVRDLLVCWADLIYTEQDRQAYLREIENIISGKQRVHDARYRVRDASGNILWIRCYGEVKYNEFDDTPLAFVGYISQQDDLLVVDPVTNFQTEQNLKLYLQQKICDFTGIGLSFNHVSEINSNWGRNYADEIISSACGQFSHVFSGKIKFFRLDGPRIVGILDSKYKEDVRTIINQMKLIVSLEYEINDIKMPNVCTFAVLNDCKGRPNFIENMIYSLKKAKEFASDEYVDFNEHIQDNKVISDKILAIGNDVMNQMDHFRVVFQPIVSGKDGSILGGETLLRWSYKGKDISPEVFIPILEEEKLIQKVGCWVFEQAVQMCKYMTQFFPDFYLSVNVSLLQLYDEDFIDYIRDTLRMYDLPGSSIILELTESCMDQHPDVVSHFIKECEALKIRIALDDFGSGFSSLRVLLKYDTKIIKLDRSLLLEMEESEEKMKFVSTLVSACQNMEKQVCVEGVETARQNAIVKNAGCDIIQGYYYFRPLEIEDVKKLKKRSCQ